MTDISQRGFEHVCYTARFRAAHPLARWVGLAGTALISACDTDQPVAPAASPASSGASTTKPNPSVSVMNAGDLVLKAVDQNQNPIGIYPTAAFTITGPNFQKPWIAWDNGVYDSDNTTGVLYLKSLATGLYKVCETTPPGTLGVAGKSCQFATVYAGSSSGLYFTNLPATHVKAAVKDLSQTLIGGSIFTVDSSGVQLNNGILDNSQADADKTSGKIDIPIRFEATYKVCAAVAPFSYMWVPNQTLCVTKAIKMGMPDLDLGAFNVIKQYSGSWKVEDGFGWGLIGPSTFHVSLPGGGQADVVDNDPTIDEDPTLGSIRVTYPFGGNYTVCETVPPAGYWNANPACKQFTVTAGVPADLGSFVDYQKQVFRP